MVSFATGWAESFADLSLFAQLLRWERRQLAGETMGKPAKVALMAVMRKLIVLMNHLLKNPNFSLAH